VKAVGYPRGQKRMDRVKLKAIVREEFSKHSYGTFKLDRGVWVPGCVNCKLRLLTISDFADHVTESVMCAIDHAEGSA
jgi:hypothetical protein